MYKVFVDANGNKSYSRVIGGEGISFVESPGNRDWEQFQEWVAEGNTPEDITIDDAKL